MKNLVVLSGAGISAASGIKTFRDNDGLWEGHDVMAVASLQGWAQNPAQVLDFYNQRRRQLFSVEPNAAHRAISELQQHYHVEVMTQNIDDLHERSGSQHVMHLHGQLRRMRSSANPRLTYPCNGDINLGDVADDGAQLRPDIVWFGEEVPLIAAATRRVASADVVLLIGTSLQVYPAADLVHHAPQKAMIYYIDSNASKKALPKRITAIDDSAVNAMRCLLPQLIESA